MISRKTSDGYVAILQRGDLLMDCLMRIARAEGITHASFQGIGAVEDVTIGYYELATKQYHFNTYTETFEVASMTGNITLVEDEPFVHAHAVLSRCDESLACIGGHIKDARTAVTLEVHLRCGAEALVRLPDDTIGLKLISL